MEESILSGPEHSVSEDGDTLQAPGLCTRCVMMIAAWESIPLPKGGVYGYVYYETTDLLEETANAGCGVCQVFLEGILPEDQERLRQNKYKPREGEKPIVGQYRRWVSGNIRQINLCHIDLGKEVSVSRVYIRDEDGQYLQHQLLPKFS
jgi:hypothetical protein